MGPKKAVPRPVNYVKKQPGMTRMLKEWYVRHKEYNADFKKRIETGLMNNDPKVLDEFKQMLSLFPELQSKNPDEFAKEMITGPDKHAILKNIEGVINARKKDTDLACLLTLLVRTGNVDKDIKYKPFHDAVKSEFPDAGIGTERRPQQLYNNLSMNPQQLLTANTWKRCEKRIDELREQLEIA